MGIVELVIVVLAQVPSTKPKPVSVKNLATPLGYRFIEVAHTRDTYQEFHGAPTLNDTGMTVFTATMDSGRMMVMYGSGGPIQFVVSTPERFTLLDGTPLISDAWDVVFTAHVENRGSGIFIKSLGRDPEIVGDTLSGFTRFRGVPDINSRSEVAFFAEVDTRLPIGVAIPEKRRPDSFPNPPASDDNPADNQMPGMGIFVSSPLITVAVDTLGSFEKIDPVVSLSDTGALAFVGTKRTTVRGVFVQIPGKDAAFPIVSDEIKYADFGPPVLTREGQLCFWTKMKDGSEAILVTQQDGGSIREIVHNDPVIKRTFDPIIAHTDAGSTLYLAREKDGPVLYLARRLGAPVRVVARGTPLGGSTVKEILIAARSLNERGQLCFHAQLANGEAVIVLATPSR